MSGYTKVDNWLFDVVMPSTKANAFKVVSAVVRCTAGWNKKSDVISMRKFKQMTGIGSFSTIEKGLDEALALGFIQRKRAGKGFKYWLPTVTETVIEEEGTITETVTPTVTETVTSTVTETVNTKEHIKTIKEHFESYAGIMPGKLNYDRDWVEPLKLILTNAGNVASAIDVISGS